MKLSKKMKVVLGVATIGVVTGLGALSLNSFEANASEIKYAITSDDDSRVCLKTELTSEDGLSEKISGNPFGFAKMLDKEGGAVATKARIDCNDDFFNELDGKIDEYEGLLFKDISEEDWLNFYKAANKEGVGKYLKESGEHSLIIRVGGTYIMDETIKFVDVDNAENHLNKSLNVDQYFIEECKKDVYVKDGLKYRKASEAEKVDILKFDKELTQSSSNRLSLKYYQKDEKDASLGYELSTVEIYNIYSNEATNRVYDDKDFSEKTLELLEKIKLGTANPDIKYIETDNLYDCFI